jgi:hypothetical protein
MELERRSSGVAKAGLTTGIIGTALGTMGILGSGASMLNHGMYGGYGPMPYSMPVATTATAVTEGGGYLSGCCSEDHFVNRYEMAAENKIAALESEIALKDANTATDGKMLEMYKYIDGQLNAINATLSAQAVKNQATQDSFQMVQDRIQCCRGELEAELANERHERRCADNTIVTYANATFYPKMIANVTTGTTTTAQVLYNPLPVESCDCNCNSNC